MSERCGDLYGAAARGEVKALTAERDALAAENKRLRHFFSDGQFGDHLASATEDGDLPIEWALKTVAMVEAALLSPQPPAASPRKKLRGHAE